MIDMVWGPGIVVWIFFRPTMSKHHPTLLYRNTDSRGAKLYFLGEHVFVCTSIPSMVAAESPMRDLDFKERNDGKCHFWDLIRVTPPERYWTQVLELPEVFQWTLGKDNPENMPSCEQFPVYHLQTVPSFQRRDFNTAVSLVKHVSKCSPPQPLIVIINSDIYIYTYM